VEFSALPIMTARDADDLDNLVPITDVSDTTDSVAGTDKKMQWRYLGGLQLGGEVDNTVSADEFDFSTIPAGFARLWLRGYVRSNNSGTTDDDVHIYFNTDTTDSNYLSAGFDAVNSNAGAVEAAAPVVAAVPGGPSLTGAVCQLSILLEDYAGANNKVAECEFVADQDTGRIKGGHYAVFWGNTAAITRIRLRASDHAGGDRLTGYLALYGQN